MFAIILALFAATMVLGLLYVLFISADAIAWFFPIFTIAFAGIIVLMAIGIVFR